MSESSLRNTLNRFYREYNFKERLKHDPVEFPHRYSTNKDIEISGFISACLAYGKVDLFKPVIEKILGPGNEHPAFFFTNFSLKRDGKYFKGLSYRFNKEKDILCLIYMLSRTLKRWDSLKNLLYYHYKPEQENIGDAVDGFIDFFLGIDTSAVYGRNIKPYGLTHFLPAPKKGSACKRINLFLRWMVRNRDIDFGIWNKIPLSKLIIPLDTHIARISRCLGLTKRTSSDWKTAREITGSLKKLDPKDPLKYDFALCHQGISGLCRGTNRIVHAKGEKAINTCSTCILKN